MTTVVVDSGDMTAIEQFRPVDATTNPSLLLNASQLDFAKPLLAQAAAYAKSKTSNAETQLSLASDKFAVDVGTAISKLVPGRVSTEVDARLSFDTEATIAKAKQLVALYQENGIGYRQNPDQNCVHLGKAFRPRKCWSNKVFNVT